MQGFSHEREYNASVVYILSIPVFGQAWRIGSNLRLLDGLLPRVNDYGGQAEPGHEALLLRFQ